MYIFLYNVPEYSLAVASKRATTHFMILDLKYQLHLTIKQLCSERACDYNQNAMPFRLIMR